MAVHKIINRSVYPPFEWEWRHEDTGTVYRGTLPSWALLSGTGTRRILDTMRTLQASAVAADEAAMLEVLDEYHGALEAALPATAAAELFAVPDVGQGQIVATWTASAQEVAEPGKSSRSSTSSRSTARKRSSTGARATG